MMNVLIILKKIIWVLYIGVMSYDKNPKWSYVYKSKYIGRVKYIR